MNKNEAPAYSIGEMDGNVAVRVDGGKFMDSQYVYDRVELGNDGIIQYSMKIVVLIVNGIVRDKLEVENQFPELIEELRVQVTDPIMFEIVNMVKESASAEPEAPRIIV